MDKTPKEIAARLKYLRGEIRKERISTGEICELQSLVRHIKPDDVELLQWAGVPEFKECPQKLEREKRRAWEHRVQKQLKRLLGAGSQLATMAFNMKQEARQSETTKAQLHESQEAWDKARKKLPRWMR